MPNLCQLLAFDGSTHFPAGALRHRFGALQAELVAETREDAVVYGFDHPSATAADVGETLDVIADLAGGATMTAEDIEKERKTVLAEVPRHVGMPQRVHRLLCAALFGGSSLAEGDPIGFSDVVQTVSPAAVRSFHQRWYRPDLVTVVLVGDFDLEAVEHAVRATLGPLAPSGEAPRPSPHWSPPRERLAVSVRDHGVRAPMPSLSLLRDAPGGGDVVTPASARRTLCLDLVVRHLQLAADEIGGAPDAPLGQLSVEDAPTPGRLEQLLIYGDGLEGREQDAAVALVTAVERARLRGVTREELDAWRREVAPGLEPPVEDGLHGGPLNAELADDAKEAILRGDPVTDPRAIARLETKVLEALTPADVQGALDDAIENARGVLLMACPQEDATCPSRGQLADAWPKGLRAAQGAAGHVMPGGTGAPGGPGGG